MSLQYCNTVPVKEFIATRPGLRKPAKNAGRFMFYYTSPSDSFPLPVITQTEPGKIQFFHWGLIPSWIKNEQQALSYRTKTLNAKSETIFKLPTYRGYIKRKRCLIPATGFIEWHLRLGTKYPFLIMVKQDAENRISRPFCFGGIYSTWVDEQSGEVWNTFSMITTPANELLTLIHNSNKRMPLIISREDESKWLDTNLSDESILDLMKPYPNELIMAHTISRKFIYQDAEPNAAQTLEPFTYKNIDTDWG